MRTFLSLLNELLWLAGAALFACFFLKSFVILEFFSAVVTLTLWRVERAWQ